MGRIFVVDVEGKCYSCKFCKTHLAPADKIISRQFQGSRGKAYLFEKAVNLNIGSQEERDMASGLYTVADCFCCCCGQIVGWKYVAAPEASQKYKEGKYVLERALIVDGVDSEFCVDSQPASSDGDEA